MILRSYDGKMKIKIKHGLTESQYGQFFTFKRGIGIERFVNTEEATLDTDYIPQTFVEQVEGTL